MALSARWPSMGLIVQIKSSGLMGDCIRMMQAPHRKRADCPRDLFGIVDG